MKKTKKFIIIIPIFILLIYLIFKFNNNGNVNYIILGDGLSKGVDSYGNIDYGYGDYIKDYLKMRNNLNKFYKSYPSDDKNIKMLIYDIKTNQKKVYKNKKINIKELLRESNVLTLSIGLNDIIYQTSITNNKNISNLNKIINNLIKDFEELIEELNKYYKNKIYVVGYYESDYYDYKINYCINKLNDYYRKNKNIIFIDTNYLVGRNLKYLDNPNSYYPNREGYKQISIILWEKIKKNLLK